MSLVDPLDPNQDHPNTVIIEKLNEVVEKFNTLAPGIQTAIAELNNIREARMSPAERNRESYIKKLDSGAITVDDLLHIWGMQFYDDVEHVITSPVYCARCMMRAQSLMDRMLTDPKAMCEGCIEKTKWG